MTPPRFPTNTHTHTSFHHHPPPEREHAFGLQQVRARIIFPKPGALFKGQLTNDRLVSDVKRGILTRMGLFDIVFDDNGCTLYTFYSLTNQSL